MKISTQKLRDFLPDDQPRVYNPVGCCIYCGSDVGLGDEHVIPFGFGGRRILPQASCRSCSALTGAFERTCLRTMFGPLRMLYDLPSRRKKDRPEMLPLKVKYKADDDWTELPVNRDEYPFLVLFPYFLMPDLLSGYQTMSGRGGVANKFWIRGASAGCSFRRHLNDLAISLGVHAIMPEVDAQVGAFCLMLAKIGHAYAVAELGNQGFEPFLLNLILHKDLSNRADVIGGLNYDEAPSNRLHELSLDDHTCNRPDLVTVRVRFLPKLDTPTYYVVAGRHIKPGSSPVIWERHA